MAEIKKEQEGQGSNTTFETFNNMNNEVKEKEAEQNRIRENDEKIVRRRDRINEENEGIEVRRRDEANKDITSEEKSIIENIKREAQKRPLKDPENKIIRNIKDKALEKTQSAEETEETRKQRELEEIKGKVLKEERVRLYEKWREVDSFVKENPILEDLEKKILEIKTFLAGEESVFNKTRVTAEDFKEQLKDSEIDINDIKEYKDIKSLVLLMTKIREEKLNIEKARENIQMSGTDVNNPSSKDRNPINIFSKEGKPFMQGNEALSTEKETKERTQEASKTDRKEPESEQQKTKTGQQETGTEQQGEVPENTVEEQPETIGESIESFKKLVRERIEWQKKVVDASENLRFKEEELKKIKDSLEKATTNNAGEEKTSKLQSEVEKAEEEVKKAEAKFEKALRNFNLVSGAVITAGSVHELEKIFFQKTKEGEVLTPQESDMVFKLVMGGVSAMQKTVEKEKGRAGLSEQAKAGVNKINEAEKKAFASREEIFDCSVNANFIKLILKGNTSNYELLMKFLQKTKRKQYYKEIEKSNGRKTSKHFRETIKEDKEMRFTTIWSDENGQQKQLTFDVDLNDNANNKAKYALGVKENKNIKISVKEDFGGQGAAQGTVVNDAKEKTADNNQQDDNLKEEVDSKKEPIEEKLYGIEPEDQKFFEETVLKSEDGNFKDKEKIELLERIVSISNYHGNNFGTSLISKREVFKEKNKRLKIEVEFGEKQNTPQYKTIFNINFSNIDWNKGSGWLSKIGWNKGREVLREIGLVKKQEIGISIKEEEIKKKDKENTTTETGESNTSDNNSTEGNATGGTKNAGTGKKPEAKKGEEDPLIIINPNTQQGKVTPEKVEKGTVIPPISFPKENNVSEDAAKKGKENREELDFLYGKSVLEGYSYILTTDDGKEFSIARGKESRGMGDMLFIEQTGPISNKSSDLPIKDFTIIVGKKATLELVGGGSKDIATIKSIEKIQDTTD